MSNQTETVTKKNVIKVIQLNMARSQAVNDQALVYCQRENIDIMLVQEPYTRYGKMPPFESAPYRVMLKEGTRVGGRQSITTWSAIVVLNPDIEILFLNHLSSMHCAVASARYPGGANMILISSYFQFRQATEKFTQELERIIRTLEPHDNLVIGADVNAFSTRWGSRITDHRGIVVEDFIDYHDLRLVNTTDHGPTYVGPRGSTNIDVTLTKEYDIELVTWRLVKGETMSDHHMIRFDIETERPNITQTTMRRFNTKKANWNKFDALLLQEHTNTNYSIDPDTNVDLITNNILKASLAAIPRNKTEKKPAPPWWTEDLTRQRVELRSAHHKLLGIQDDPIHHQTAMNRYKQCRNNYVRSLRKAKHTSWTHFTSSGNVEKWGRCYKWLKKGSVKQQIPIALKKDDGSFTTNMNDTISVLLDALVPSAQGEDDNVVASIDTYNDVELCDEEEVRQSIWRMNSNKAPGHDNITGHILKRAWPIIKDQLVDTFNKCVKNGYFPSKWKRAELIIISKGPHKDPTEPKSYRPISLLTTMSKALEHIVCTRLQRQVGTLMSNKQHGFTQGKSTYSAIQTVMHWTASREEKYVLGIFLDISGAFDNLNWESLIGDIEMLGAKPYITSMVKNYLSGRIVHLKKEQTRITKTLTRGCPQGSEFGPTLWKIAMNSILAADQPPWTTRIAYADDLLIQVAANTRQQLKERAEQSLADLTPWAVARTLTFSPEKSQALIMKGGLTPGFTIKFHNTRIRSVDKLKYLGVWLNTNMGFTQHIENLLENSNDLFSRMKGASGLSWGYNTDTKIMFYNTIYLTRITYGSMFWASSIRTKTMIEKIQSAQRRALLAITKAYRTTSTAALQVIAGLLPLDLAIKCAAVKQRNRWTNDHIDTVIYYDQTLQTWQDRWETTEKGRETFDWLPNVITRIKTPLEIDPFIVQFMTGHGDFNAKLCSFNLIDSPECQCGNGHETAEHVLFHCQRVEEYRINIRNVLNRIGIEWPPEKTDLLISKSVFNATRRFAKRALENRNDR